MPAVLERESEVVTFQATAVQERLMEKVTDGESRIIGFGGGIRGTKTWGVLGVLITLCKVFPGSRWAVIRKDLQRLRDTTIPSFDKLRTLTGGFIGEVNQQRWEAECLNGSRILFRGENIDKDRDLLRFHGYEVNGFANEEADELSERTFNKEIERAGTWIVPNGGEQPPAYILNTFNPCASWPKRKFYIPWRDQTIRPPYAFIPSTAADNPYISDQQREAWLEMPEAEYKRFVIGDWESITGAYYDTLDVNTHLIDRDRLPNPIPEHWKFWGSFDWGYGHWAVMGAWCTDEDGVDYLLDSCWLRKKQDDEMADIFKTELSRDCLRLVYAGGDCWAKHTAHGASGDSTADVFARKGIVLVQADTDQINGGRAVNRKLKVRIAKLEDGTEVKRSRAYIVRTTGNLRVVDQLGEIMPDENDIRKPDKTSGRFDADASTGAGGDDGADMFRFGVAKRMAAPVAAEKAEVAEGHSLGYDYEAGKPRERQTGEDFMTALLKEVSTPRQGRYHVPVRRSRL